MDIVSLVSRITHQQFEVAAVRTRDGVDTDIRIVVHQDMQDWQPADAGSLLTRQDMLSLRTEYDLQQNDLVTVTDRSAVIKDVVFTVTGRSAEMGDGHISMWKVKVKLS